MGYEKIDAQLNIWATKHKLTVYTQHQDSEVRSTDVVDMSGNKYQIWIDIIDNDTFLVNVWDYKKRIKKLSSTTLEIEKKLEEAYQIVAFWISKILP